MSQIDDYVATLTPEQQAATTHLRTTVKRLYPDATDGWSYSMPTIKYRGHGLVAFMVYAHHIGFYPFGGAPIEAVKDQLTNYKTSKGAVQFTIDKPLPQDALERMIHIRAEQIEQLTPKEAK